MHAKCWCILVCACSSVPFGICILLWTCIVVCIFLVVCVGSYIYIIASMLVHVCKLGVV